MSRVASLLASATEIVCALGREADLVARSHECDWPPSVRRLPQASRPAFPTAAPSRMVDLAVRERLARALSIYEVDAEVLRTVRPTVILTQTQCAVCAVTPADVERAICLALEQPVRIVALEPNRLADVWSDIAAVARALGVEPAGEELVARLRERVAAIRDRAAAADERPTVATIEWIEPLMAAGNWMPELVEAAGGRHSPWLQWSELARRDPDVVIVSPCGFGIARTLEEMHLLTRRAEWAGLRAVRGNRVYVVDGNAYFHRPGPRLVESLEILAELLHPETFAFGHEGRGWRRYS